MKLINRKNLAKLIGISKASLFNILNNEQFIKFRYKDSKFYYIYSVRFLYCLEEYFEDKIKSLERPYDISRNKKNLANIKKLYKNIDKNNQYILDVEINLF